jgi:hypothetical protein
MSNQSTIDNLKALGKMATNIQFVAALSHLFSVGCNHFTDEAYAADMSAIDKAHEQAAAEGVQRIMSKDFEKEVLSLAFALSKYPLTDLMLFIKKHIYIYDPEAADAEDTEETEYDEYDDASED